MAWSAWSPCKCRMLPVITASAAVATPRRAERTSPASTSRTTGDRRSPSRKRARKSRSAGGGSAGAGRRERCSRRPASRERRPAGRPGEAPEPPRRGGPQWSRIPSRPCPTSGRGRSPPFSRLAGWVEILAFVDHGQLQLRIVCNVFFHQGRLINLNRSGFDRDRLGLPSKEPAKVQPEIGETIQQHQKGHPLVHERKRVEGGDHHQEVQAGENGKKQRKQFFHPGAI